jgi:hypothetical protein
VTGVGQPRPLARPESIHRCHPAGSLVSVSSKSERRAAREDVATYHEEQLSLLVMQVAEATDRFRAGELEAFEVDHVLFQYSRAAKELWKFCSLGPVESTASLIRTDPPSNWWARAAPRQR